MGYGLKVTVGGAWDPLVVARPQKAFRDLAANEWGGLRCSRQRSLLRAARYNLSSRQRRERSPLPASQIPACFWRLTTMLIFGWMLVVGGLWGALGFVYLAARPRFLGSHSRASDLLWALIAFGVFGGPGLWLVLRN